MTQSRNSSHNCAKRIGNATEIEARMCTFAVATRTHVRTVRIMTVMELDREAYLNEENNTTEQECEEG